MKKYLKEIIIVLLQLFMFYIFPVFAGPTDTMGMVLLIILATLLLATILGTISNNKIFFHILSSLTNYYLFKLIIE